MTDTKLNQNIENVDEIKLSTLAALGLSGALLSGPSTSGADARGIRNNNPGNIKKSSIEWKGATGNDGTFVTFASPEDGIRALARILSVYNSKYNLSTVRQIINRWAPPSENKTDKYVEFVAGKLGKKPNDQIDFKNKNELANLISAIIQYENGRVPYDKTTIINGINKL